MSKRVFILLFLAIAAIILYGIGFKTSSLAVFILAALVELGFWFKLLHSDKPHQSDQRSP